MSETKVPILLVDDRPANLLALEVLLESPAYELVSVDSGRKALVAAQQRDFAVVLLDVMMPDLDGFATARELRRLNEARPTPIIFVTGGDRAPSHILHAYSGGAADFVQKPLDPTVIRSKVAIFAELYRARTRLAVQEERAARSVRALTDVALALSGTRTLEEVATAILDAGIRVAEANTCSLYLLDEAGAELELIGHRGIEPEIVEQTRRLATTDAFRTAEITWVETAAEYARLYPALANAKADGRRARAFWRMPLLAEGQPVGLLGVGFYEERPFPPHERALVETLGKQCAQALLRAVRLDTAARTSAWLSTTLRSIGDAVIATDTAGRVKFMNGVAERLTGWPEDEARGRELEDVFPIFSEETRAACESPVAKVLREGRVVSLANHTFLRARGGAETPIDDSAAPIFDAKHGVVGVVLIFRDVSGARREHVRRDFLVRAGGALASSLDVRVTLATIAQFAVPELADWCTVDLLEPEVHAPTQVAVAHADPEKVRWARELGQRYPPDPNALTGVPQVIRSGKSELYPELSSAMLEAGAKDEEHLRIIRELRLESAMIVPLLGRERTLGAMTFIYAGSARRYGDQDLAFAEEFARRAAISIENAKALGLAEDLRALQQKVADEQLYASESRFHQLIDAVTDYAIFMLDATGHVATWNPGAQKNKGYKPHEILGQHFSVFYTPEDRAAGKPEQVLDTVRREGRFEDESFRLRKDGTRFWANVVITALRGPTGEITGFAKVTRDLTAKRAAEENQRELVREQLARETSERGRSEMERMNRLKDEFLATMSHELRTPLNAITGWTAILRKKPREESKLERGLEVIERNAKAQTRLVTDLLDVSRIINGKLQLNLAKTEVLPLIVATADVVRPAADGKGVRLVVDIDPDVGATMADADRLQQIVWNLLSNAIRFTPRGGRVTVTCDRVGSGIQISVRDTGAGIATEHLPQIFERFKQVDSSTTRAHGGLGLGLAIVRHLVDAHGGSVEARSEGLGHGATFTISLPIRAVTLGQADEAEVDVRAEATEREQPSPSLENVRVLVVDDDEDSLEVLREVLELAGAQVTTALSARAAFAALDAGGVFELIISDIGMPETDGYTFIRRVRSSESGADVPAIALTAYARATDATHAIHAGFQEHLVKPVDEKLLLRAVKTWSRVSVRVLGENGPAS